MTNDQKTKLDKNESEKSLDAEDVKPSFAWPTVVAVVVAHSPGDWMEECLTSLENEDYPDLTTLVFDINSEEDLTERVAKAMPSAFVRRSDEELNFAQAVNIAVNSIEGATYVLVCHDDVIIQRGSLAKMVEEAFRSNASIVGPKIVDAKNPDELIEVGGMIDRFGVPFSGIEPEEVDQGQHDGVRDVFYVSSAAMLVRADLFRALEGFDNQCFPGAEDIDLAWRAHLVGARVLVQPEAVVLHHRASDRQRKARVSSKAIVARHRMRAVVKNSSKTSLAWILPISFLLHSIEGFVWLLRFDPKRSFLLFSGWIWNIRNLKELRKQRKEVQKTRQIPDREISRFQIGGSARIRKFFTSIVRNRQLKLIASASKSFASTRYSQATRQSPYILTGMALYLLAVRNFFFNSIPATGNMSKWPDLTAQINALVHGGLPVASEPSYSSTLSRLVSILFTTLFFGNAGLAQTVFVVSLIPIGCYGVKLLMLERNVIGKANTVGIIVYGSFGTAIFAFSQGGLDVLILMSLIPYFMRALANRKLRQSGIFAALMIAFVPAALVLVVVLAIAFSIVGHQEDRAIKEGSLRAFIDGLRFTATAISIALLINIGLLIDLTRRIDRSALGLSDASLSLEEYLFPNLSMTVFSYIVAGITLWALVVCRNDRVSDIRVLIVTFGLLFAVMGFLISLDQPLLDSSALIALLQLVCALSAAVCVFSYFDEMKQRSFGIAHIGTGISVIAVLVVCVSSFWVIPNGTMGMPDRSWPNQISVEENARVVYIGDSRTIPGRSVLAPLNRSFLITGTSGANILTSRVGPATKLDDEVREIYSAMMARDTQHSGRMFARLGVEVIAVPLSIAPGQKVNPVDQPLLRALDSQVDLVRIGDREGLVVYLNSVVQNPFTLDSRAQNIEISDALSQIDAPEITTSQRPIYDSTLVVSALTLLAFLGVILWPRRKNLLSQSPALASKLKQSSKKNTEIDLTKESEKSEQEAIDLNLEHDVDKVMLDADSSEVKK